MDPVEKRVLDAIRAGHVILSEVYFMLRSEGLTPSTINRAWVNLRETGWFVETKRYVRVKKTRHVLHVAELTHA